MSAKKVIAYLIFVMILSGCSVKRIVVQDEPICPIAVEKFPTKALVLEDKETYTKAEILEYVRYVRIKFVLKQNYIKDLEAELKCLRREK